MQARIVQQTHHSFRGVRGGQINIPDRTPQNGIPHTAPDKAHILSTPRQGRENRPTFGGHHPILFIQPVHLPPQKPDVQTSGRPPLDGIKDSAVETSLSL